jgi:N-dimethylarginine dimethylaminohydrolase
MAKTKTVLMSPPTYYDIEYEINEWMDTSNPVNHKKAAAQWQKLYDTYSQLLDWDVQLIDPVKGLPDMVFTANGGLVLNDKVVLPRFRHSQRQPETQKFKKWFQDAGFQDIFLPEHNFEGEGDAFAWHDMLFAGYPYRSKVKAHHQVAEFLGLKPISLEQINPRFYHLDTALTFINDETVAIYPGAFSDKSLALIHKLVPKVIQASEEDALAYGLNAMTDGQNIILSDHPGNLIKQYKDMGLNVFSLDISEFQKSGGGVKCLTLDLR